MPLDSVTVLLVTLVLPVMKVRLLSKFTSSQYTCIVSTYLVNVSISDHYSLPQESDDYSLLCLTATGVCQSSCVNGICNETTGQCDCTPGYTGVSCDESKTFTISYTVCMYSVRDH